MYPAGIWAGMVFVPVRFCWRDTGLFVGEVAGDQAGKCP